MRVKDYQKNTPGQHIVELDHDFKNGLSLWQCQILSETIPVHPSSYIEEPTICSEPVLVELTTGTYNGTCPVGPGASTRWGTSRVSRARGGYRLTFGLALLIPLVPWAVEPEPVLLTPQECGTAPQRSARERARAALLRSRSPRGRPKHVPKRSDGLGLYPFNVSN